VNVAQELRKLADVLEKEKKWTWTVARGVVGLKSKLCYGGEEFLILTHELETGMTTTNANRLVSFLNLTQFKPEV